MIEIAQGFALALAFLALYFLPLMVGALRNAPNRMGMLLGNLFFGWTVIGWIAVLFWACMEEIDGDSRAASTAPSPSTPARSPFPANGEAKQAPPALVFLNRVGRMLTGL